MDNRRALLLVVLLWIAGLGAAGQFAKIAVPFGVFAQVYPGNAAHIGWLLSIISLIGAVFGAFAGALVGALGLRRVLIAGVVGGGLVSLWQALLPGFGVMLVSRVLEGVTHLAIVVAAPTLIAQASPTPWRGAAMALWSTFFGAGFALFAWAGLPLVETRGVGALLAAHGVAMLSIGAVLAWVLPRDARGGAMPRFGDVMGNLGRALRSPFVAAPGVAWLFYTLTFLALLAVLPDRLPPESRAPIVAAMPLLGTGVALLLVPVLLRHVAASWLTIAGFAAAAALVPVMGGVSVAVLCLTLYPVLGLVQGAGFAAVPELNLSDEGRAMGYGLMAQTGNIGNLAGTPLLLAVMGRGGEPALIWVVTGIYICACVVLLALHRRRGGQVAA
ncbi:MFS transporter [Marinibacterium profundimaris]|uniref:Major facilitator superfamily (MFS) profile domain-containing protein n=1 Tax=Marinibacterium profundimaris TaxID=1679460 RepID=A0A225NN81_9RHOB|nr:MFS transporter [Marinibacterium profundimaris]OWU75951.1 hypothetical protein ATO3_07185 [Marinibacterium profundimaris]